MVNRMVAAVKVRGYHRKSRRGRPYFVRSYLKTIERQAQKLRGRPEDCPDKVALDVRIDEAYLRGTISVEEYTRLMRTLHAARPPTPAGTG